MAPTAGHPGPIKHRAKCDQGKGAAGGACGGIQVWRARVVDAQVAAGEQPGQCMGKGLREGTHVGVSERGEEEGERDDTLHKVHRDTGG